jgi:prolyl oligopeptidase
VCALAICLVVGVACSREPAAPAASAPLPDTRPVLVTETLHGVEIADRYRWLEEDTPDVAAWTDAQNRYTSAVLGGLAGRKALEDRLRPLVQVGSVTAPVMRANRYFYARRAAGQEEPAVFVREGALGGERMLIDPTKLQAAGRGPAIWFLPSASGKLLAYGTDQNGEGLAVLRLLDVETGTPLADEIPNVLEGVQWMPDDSGFVYDNLAEAGDSSSRQGRFHRVGAAPASDAILYRHPTKVEHPRMAQTGGPAGTLSRDGRWLVLSYWLDAESNDVWLARFDEYRRIGARAAKPVSIGLAGRAHGTVIGDTLFLYTTKGAPKGRIVAAATARPDVKHWREIVAERPEAIESVAFGRGVIAVTYVARASTAIELFDFSGGRRGTLTLPGLGTASLGASEDRTEAYLTFASFNHPPTVYRVDLADPAAAPKYWSGPVIAADPASIDVRQVSYPSKDGTPITMFLAHRKGLAPDGSTPTLLSGYGAFNVSMVPMFAAPFLQWFEAGGMLAIANLRGGGEYGDAWHQSGMLDRKQNSVADFIAAAEWLIANRHTNPQKLAIMGQSNGGLAAGAALVERPDLFRAALLERPLLDMLRYHKFAREPYWAAEYGTADSPEQFKWLLAYSPYQRVKPGTSYPAVLLTAVEGDAEVHALHARKMAAALQAATASDRSRQPVLLRVDRPPQDPAALFELELRDLVDQRIFLMWQLGMP